MMPVLELHELPRSPSIILCHEVNVVVRAWEKGESLFHELRVPYTQAFIFYQPMLQTKLPLNCGCPVIGSFLVSSFHGGLPNGLPRTDCLTYQKVILASSAEYSISNNWASITSAFYVRAYCLLNPTSTVDTHLTSLSSWAA